MDPSLTTTQAHQKFGELYRKSRPPELQEKVDKIVASTSDVFVRIARIEELDEGVARARRAAERGAPLKGGPVRGGGGGARSPAKAPAKKKEVKAGFFERLFGGELAVWGRANGTLEGSGLFSLNVHLSAASQKLFNEMSEEMIVPTIKAFRGAAGFAWEYFEPGRYNAMLAGFQTFNELVKAKGIFQRSESPEDWITQTIKLQKFYAMMLQFPEYEKTLIHEFPEVLGKREQTAALQAVAREAMSYLVSLEKRRPSLSNTFAAFYSLARKRVFSWDDVCKEMKIGRPALDAYRGPDQVLEVINRRISDLKGKYGNRQEQMKEIKRLREKYLRTDASGRLNTDFLDPVVSDAVRRSFGESAMTEGVLASFKREPHRLLFAVLKDFDASCMSLFTGTVSIRGAGTHSQEVTLFIPGLFKKHADLFAPAFRDTEIFLKKYRDINYSFTDFLRHTKEPPQDAILKQFHENVRSANRFFNVMARDLYTVLYNADAAADSERNSGDHERFARSKTIPIDSLQPGARHIPHGREEIVASTRLNGKTVQAALEETLHHLCNYMYIFREAELIDLLGLGPSLEKEMAEFKEELTRLGVAVQ